MHALDRHTFACLAAVLCLTGALPTLSPSVEARGTSAIPVDLTEEALVPRIEWPIHIGVMEGGDPAVCERLGPDKIVVKENGVKARVTNVDREHRPTVHALLLDTSGSMWTTNRLERVRHAAEEYVRLIDSGDDQVMVVTFDTDLILRVPMTRLASAEARERVIKGIRRVPGDGTSTDIAGSLYQLRVFLREVPGRTVVILLTDGISYGTARGIRLGLNYDPDAINNVTVFPIGIGLARPREKEYLKTLAHDAGGFFYPVAGAGQVKGAFADIQRRLRREAFVTYEPPSGKLKPRKRRMSETAEQEVRRVKIVSTVPSCEVAAYKRKRVVAENIQELILSGADPKVLYFTSVPGRSPGDLVIPGVEDITVEPGWNNLDPPSAGLRKILPPGPCPAFEFESRDVELHVPPVAAAGLYEAPGPADMLARWLMAGVDPVRGDDPDDPYFRTLNGQSYLELRMFLAARILEFSKPHREFAQAKMETAIRKKLDREIRAEVVDATYAHFAAALEGGENPAERAAGVDRLQIEVLLRAFRGETVLPDRNTVQQSWARERERLLDMFFEIRRNDPTPEDYQALRGSVVAWLGDASARDLAFELEKRAANAWLGSAESDVDTVPADVLQVRWDFFNSWFPALRLQRIFTPLWLAYDADRDVFGFHRIFFPRSPERFPPAPYGLRVIDLLLAESERGRGRWRIVSVDHRDTPLDELSKKLKSKLKNVVESLQRVTIELAETGDGRPAKIDVLYVKRLDGSEDVPCGFDTNDFDAGLSPCVIPDPEE